MRWDCAGLRWDCAGLRCLVHPIYISVLYFAWNLITILVLICWSIVTTLIFFGPLAYFDLLGKIPDTNDETVEMREIVTTNETFKKGIEKNLLIY